MKNLNIILVTGLFSLVGVLPLSAQLTNLGYIVVSPNGPNDGADYGPFTPGTQTSGIQEALDDAKNNIKEVYIMGGPDNGTSGPVVYDIHTTLTVPWGQDWHIDGGNYILNFTQTSGNCLVIDSQMSCRMRFGSVRAPNLTSGSVVQIRPTTVGPDNFNVIEVSLFEFVTIQGGGNPDGGAPGKGIGLHLLADTTPNGNISDSIISVQEITACETGLKIEGNRGVVNNQISCQLIHNCNTAILDQHSALGDITAAVAIDGVTGSVTGVNLNGSAESVYHLRWLETYPAGTALVLSGQTHDNMIFATNLPTNGIATSPPTNPTNIIIPTSPVGFDITTPSMPASNINRQNKLAYSVAVTILTPGNVSEYRITDASGNFQDVIAPVLAGQSLILEPGESIRFTYPSIAPTWVWRALR